MPNKITSLSTIYISCPHCEAQVDVVTREPMYCPVCGEILTESQVFGKGTPDPLNVDIDVGDLGECVKFQLSPYVAEVLRISFGVAPASRISIEYETRQRFTEFHGEDSLLKQVAVILTSTSLDKLRGFGFSAVVFNHCSGSMEGQKTILAL